jgi:ParB/RepB/Spo0J family partition protein
MTTTTSTIVETVQHLPIALVAPSPDNVRSSLGNLDDLVRSIKASGILVPLLVLPADAEGVHHIVAGHRRYAAAVKAGRESVAVIVRDLTPLEVLDAMLVENSQREDLGLRDSIVAMARYQVLAPTESVTKIAKRIGRTPVWCKTRLALAVLPVDVLDLLDTGRLTMPVATALAGLVDEGDDVIRACAAELAGRHHHDPVDAVDRWHRRLNANRKLDDLIAKLDATGVQRFENHQQAREAKAMPLGAAGIGLDKDQARAHRHEECHGVVIDVYVSNGKVEAVGYCTNPKRHRTTATKQAVSEIAVEQFAPTSPTAINELDRARKAARKARAETATALLSGGRTPKTEAVILAALVWCQTAGSLALAKACEFLAVEPDTTDGFWDRSAALSSWLDDGGDPHRLLVALTGGEIETRSRQVDPLPSSGGWVQASQRWLDLLTARGYVPEGHDFGSPA